MRRESAPGNIGKPLGNVSCFIIEPASSSDDTRRFRLLPRGEPGELAVGGHQLARGYLNRPEQTDSAFIDSPYGRVYRTGDRAVLKPDGTLECLGRLSEGQVKLRGQRIELGEIEQAALRLPQCHGAVAAVVGSTLVLFCAGGRDLSESTIRASCEEWLPQFMVPGDVLLLDQLPRLASGKVDAKKLKSDYRESMDQGPALQPTLNEDESVILKIFQKAMGTDVSSNSVMSHIGVDSLSAITLASSFRREGYVVTVPQLLKLRTVGDVCRASPRLLASNASSYERANKTNAIPAAYQSIIRETLNLLGSDRSVTRFAQCTPLQAAMLAETSKQPSIYYNNIELQFEPESSANDLQCAFAQVVEDNEVLRTGFIATEIGHVATVFGKAAGDQATVVESLNYELAADAPGHFLSLFRVQVQKPRANLGSRVLIHAHHAIYDGWSLDMILLDVCNILRGISRKPRPQFYAAHEYFISCQGEDGDTAKAFWSRHLHGWTRTPTPRLTTSAASGEVRVRKVERDIRLSPNALQKFSMEHSVSAQVLFQAAVALVWQGVLGPGQSEVVIGSVLSGRSAPVQGIEDVIGPCIASMPLRVDFGKASTGIELLRSIHGSNRAIMEHCHLPLADVCRLASLQPSETLYDVLFVFQQSIASRESLDEHFTEIQHTDRVETKLLIEVEPQEGGYKLQATYHPSFISADLVSALCHQIGAIATLLSAEPSVPLAALTRPDTKGASVAVAPEIETQDQPFDVPSLIEQSISRHNGLKAIEFLISNGNGSVKTEELSYTALGERSAQVAHYLRSNGIQIGEIVPIIMEKSIELYVSILGIIRAGCAYMPLLPTTPTQRLSTILAKSRASFCVLAPGTAKSMTLPDQIRALEIDSSLLADFPSTSPETDADPNRLAYVIYTSGTSGTPKGVAITQRNLASNIVQLSTIYPRPSHNAALLQLCSQAFDVSVFEIFFTWYSGMVLAVAPNDVAYSDLEGTIRRLGVTHLSLTPTVAALIRPRNVPLVEFLVTAGEPMTQAVLDQWGALLWQGYGPSETTNICSVKRMSPADNITHLGWVFPNTLVAVLSPSSQDPVPIGWVGEFCFGGSQVAAGYLYDEGLTRMSFVNHPLLGRLYRSGDLGRMLPDGSLIILGRLDDQLKLHGQRIEATEINSIVTTSAMASSAFTVLVNTKAGKSDQLATFYRPAHLAESVSGPLPINTDRNKLLFARLAQHVPGYMIPSYLIPVSCIPTTSSGKVDRRQLHQWFAEFTMGYAEQASNKADTVDDGSDEWTSTETAVLGVIARAMQLQDKFGRWTPFAALGIDSVTAIRLSRALTVALDSNVSVSVSDILQNPSIAQLGRALDTAHKASSGGARQRRHEIQDAATQLSQSLSNKLSHIDKNIEMVLPCMPLQEAMLSRGDGYFNRILLRLHVSPAEMKSHWTEMTERHSILRTCFVTTDNVSFPIAQVVLRRRDIPWHTFHVTALSLEDAVRGHLRTLPEALDSLTPPCSFAIIRYRESRFLSFICHHSLYDGVAMESLWREVEALAAGRALPPPVSHWPFLQTALSLPADVEAFWTEKLRDYHPKTAFAHVPSASANQCTHTASVDVPYNELQQKLQSMDVSMLSLCQASWALVVATMYGDTDVAFGNVVSGRTIGVDGIERLVAPCFNTIPMRMNIAHSSQHMDLLEAFQTLNEQLLPYHFSPLKLIQKTTRGNRHIFDTLLLLQKPLQDMDRSVWTLEEDSGGMDVPIVCEVVPCPSLNSIVVHVHYDMNMTTGDLASAIGQAFTHMMRSMLNSPFASAQVGTALPTGVVRDLSALKVRRHRGVRDTTTQARPDLDDSDWSATEAAIRQIITSMAQVPLDAVKRATTIFQVGLDSINAVQIAAHLRKQDISVSASDVIECASCFKLAARAEQNHAKGSTRANYDTFAGFRRATEKTLGQSSKGVVVMESVLPCTPMQNAMLAASMSSAERQYLNYIAYEPLEGVEGEALSNAWGSLESAHPMLQRGFVQVEHGDSAFAMVQTRSDARASNIEVIHKEMFESAFWKKEAKEHIVANLHLPPWRVALVDCPGQVEMHLVIHHALYDRQTLDEMLDTLLQFLGGQHAAFASIEPALAGLLSESQHYSEAQRFWENLADQAVINSFPVLTPLREPRQPLRCERKLSRMPSEQMRSLTSALGVSTQAVMQAAWARLLSSYLGEQSVVFGTTLSGRTKDSTVDSPLPCLATVPIVVVVADCSSNRELLDKMMSYNAQLHKFQFSPLSAIQKWLGYPSSPVFDTLIAYHRPREPGAKRHIKVKSEQVAAEFAASLEAEALEDGSIEIALTARPDVVPTEQARLILSQFDAIMCHLLQKPQEDGVDLRKNHQDLYSVTPSEIPIMPAPVHLVHEFVEQRARTSPDSPALEIVYSISGREIRRRVWSYAELDKKGNQVANLLLSSTKAGDIVAIHFRKCPEAYFAILGILKAGCSYVALDPDAPSARKEFILQDSRASCLLTSQDEDEVLFSSTPVTRIDETVLAQHSDGAHSTRNIPPTQTCYCLYTSGTTGTPKGCEITHENVVQAMMAFQKLFHGHWDRGSRWLQFASLHFDVSVLEQYWSWSVGITVVAAPKDLILDDLIASIHALEITHIDLTPSLARLTHPSLLPNLCRGVFITGGEQLNQDVLNAWGPESVIYNAYGPTEATIGVTMYRRVPVNGRPSNIGRQFPNVGTFVFEPGTEMPVLRGAVGELCVSGKLVGKGYLNRPELTLERFPTASEFGERIYRTGDLVRILHDGCIEFLGRADDQVKLRGQRLEIGEINHTIRETEGIDDAATVVLKHVGKDSLVAFIVGDDENKSAHLSVLPDADNLASKARVSCLRKLPGYMVPTYFIRIPHMPLSSNNKVEAKMLKKLFQDISQEELLQLSAQSTAASSSLNATILGKVARLLGDFSGIDADAIRPLTGIFDLGVDSISVLRLSKSLQSAGFAALTPSAILRSPTVADLVRAAEDDSTPISDQKRRSQVAQQNVHACQQRYMGVACRELGLEVADIEYIAPCSALQEGIISAALGGRQPGVYFNSFDLQLGEDGVLTEAVQAAWLALVASQPILRTAFIRTKSGYVQVAKRTDRREKLWQTMQCDGDKVSAALARLREEWVDENQPNVTRPLRFVHVKGPTTTNTLRIFMFHAIYDGNSLRLMNELAMSAAYNGIITPGFGGASFLEALCHGPLLDFTYTQPFWVEQLKNWQRTEMPKLAASPQTNGTSATRTVPLAQFEALRKKYNVTLQAVILSAWTYTLHDLLEKPPTIGLVLAGRSMDLIDAESTVGPLFNTLPFFPGRPKELTWESLVRLCHDFYVKTVPFQHVPLKYIQKWCSNAQPLFDNLFTFQVEQPAAAPKPWELVDGGAGETGHGLAFEATKCSTDRLQLLVAGRSEYVDEALLQRLLDVFERGTTAMVEETPLARLLPMHEPVNSSASAAINEQQPTGEPDDSWTPTARTIQQELSKLSSVPLDSLSPATSILQLGIDSIDAIKLSARLASQSLMLSPSQIIRHQTIRAMGHAAEPGSRSAPQFTSTGLLRKLKEETLPVRDRGGLKDVEVLPCTALQESMVAGMVQSDFDWYFNHEVLEICSDVDLDRLESAWNNVVASSPILRTGFAELDERVDAAYCQVVYYPPRKHTIPRHTLSATSDIKAILADNTSLARQGKARDNLFQVHFASTGDTRYMIVSMAHALYDGWSLGLMYADVLTAYNAGGFAPRTPPEDHLFRLVQTSPDGLLFWTTHLANASPTRLPERHNGAKTLGRFEMDSAHSADSVMRYCKSSSISLQALCMACWSVVVAQRTGSLDVVFGAVLSRRDFVGADELMFPTMNTVPMRVVLHGSVNVFLQHLEESLADVREHQGVPLRKMHAGIGQPASGLFNSLFILQKAAPTRTEFDSMFKPVDGSAAVEYPVCVEVEHVGARHTWRLACDDRFFTEDETKELAATLDQVLGYLMQPPADVLSFDHGLSVCGLRMDTTPTSDAPSSEAAIQSRAYTATEVAIVQALSQASSVPEAAITPQSTLYHLGLDSISAIKVSQLLRKKGVHLRPRELIQAKTIYDMGDSVGLKDAAQREAWDTPSSWALEEMLERCGISQGDVEVVLPATAMQVYMLSAWQNEQGALFFPEFGHKVDSQHTRSDIDAAWLAIMKEWPILRTRFVTTCDAAIPWGQVIATAESINAGRARQPLVRLGFSQSESSIRLRIHHALYDGFSLPLLMERLQDKLASGKPQPDTLSKWIAFCTRALPSDSQRRFWTGYLGKQGSTTVATTASSSYFRRNALAVDGIRAFAAHHGIGVQSLFLAAYAQTLGVASAIIGVYLANRTDLTTYPTLTLVPLRVELAGNLATVAAAIQDDIHRITSGNQHVGLWQIYEWTGVRVSTFVNFLAESAESSESAGAPPADTSGVAVNEPWGENNLVAHVYPVRHRLVSRRATNIAALCRH